MARLNVNTTRMELTRLREKLGIAKRGHKLLKDKQDILIRNFIALSENAINLRKEVEVSLAHVNNGFVLSSSINYEGMLLMNLSYLQSEAVVHVETERMLNVKVPSFGIEVKEGEEDADNLYPYSFLSTASDIDNSAKSLQALVPKIIKLAQIEKSCQILSAEIETTRRRVNALEFRTIADLEETIRYILMKIEENERNTTARLSRIT